MGHFGREKLQSYEAMQSDVFGLVDHTHAAATQFFQDAVMGNGPAGEGLGFLH